MSRLQIEQYLNHLADLRRVGGTRESVVRDAFKTLLTAIGKTHDLIFVSEYEYTTPAKERRYIDGALVANPRVPVGFWEAKDEKDDLEEEIRIKFRRGYPQDNIIFEDSRKAVLYQNGKRVMDAGTEDIDALDHLLKLFFGYEPPQIAEFRKAVEKFKEDLPQVLKGLRETMDEAEASNPKFKKALLKFLKHARETINPSLGAADMREMLIQHILTEEIFAHVFDNSDFHTHNNVARELYALEGTFFTGAAKRETLAKLRPYYAAIRSAAALVSSHHEKQKFLKVIYENFYKVYNPKAADRLGVVYTPNEIVRFMVESADWLCQKHFKKSLIDEHVEILDPAAGTGTFIVELIEHFRGQKDKLRHKYLEELHANEVAILPYYVANLNIEATYAATTGEYLEYPNLCFVDTLDNVGGLRKYAGHMDDLFGSVSEENIERIKRQNRRKISVIIGNPPYNANQANENENNKNREYPDIDKRIKETYIAASTAQKTKLYDMYARFFRWASDRVDENGIVALITNRSFIESRTFDGFRKVVAEEFNDIYIVDLGGDVRSDPRLSGTKHNVFGIQTGVAISFLVKGAKTKGCRIRYVRRPQLETAEEKLAFLSDAKAPTLPFEQITPSKNCDWLNLTSNDFETFIPIADKRTKTTKVAGQERAIFRLFSLGVSTSRDEWVYGETQDDVRAKTNHLIDVYNADVDSFLIARQQFDAEELDYSIKWTRSVKADLQQGRKYERDAGVIAEAAYRPFTRRHLHFNGRLVEVQYQQTKLFGEGADLENSVIALTDAGSQKEFMCLAVGHVFDYHFVGAAAAAVGVGRVRYGAEGKLDNITDWALKQFRLHYEKGTNPKRRIDKDAIFHYVYGVLHDPAYREKYAQNLKREFPRIPFYVDFWKWVEWGEALMMLHLGYEAAEPWPLELVHSVDKTAKKSGIAPKVILKPLKDTGTIVLDSETQLTGVPSEAWNYRLGNRSALEWILDQYKEKTPKDPTIRDRFNSYRFADHKDQVIDLLKRVTRVSVETQAIIEEMKAAKTGR